MLGLRVTITKPQVMACAEFATLWMHLIKSGVRISATASRVNIVFATTTPEAALFVRLAGGLQLARS